MSKRSWLLSPLPCSLLLAVGLTGCGPPPREEGPSVRGLLNGVEFKEDRQRLIEMGEKAFPAYEAILADQKATPEEVARVFGVLCYVQADRCRFLKHALSRLRDADWGVRLSAVHLLREIGNAANGPAVVALLSDRLEVAYAAAKTLAIIGGPRELEVMDAWLRGPSQRGDELRQHVQKCRDALKERLAKVAKKAK